MMKGSIQLVSARPGTVSLLLLCSLSLCSACTGPSTPLGAVWTLKLPDLKDAPTLFQSRIPAELGPQVSFSPSRQVLHGSRTLTITIQDPVGVQPDHYLKIRYNGLDVTTTFLRQARLVRSVDQKQLRIIVPSIHLQANTEHDIEVLYGRPSGARIVERYPAPNCHFSDSKYVLSTEGFEPSPDILTAIDTISRQAGVNPALTTGLVAQESSFNPRTVSWARAIGLTQVTGIAEAELGEMLSRWPRYPGINELPVPLVKGLVLTGHVNSDNEWRLNPEQSIRGGLAYVKLLAALWDSPQNRAKIAEIFDDPEFGRAQVILASYNAGFARVSAALQKNGSRWLASEELKGIRKYINRIVSYCDHFSNPEPEVEYDQET